MDKLNKDELFLIAIELNLPELLNFCESSKKINKLICKKNDIWLYKLNKDYPNYKDFNIDKSYRKIYKTLYGLEKFKQKIKFKYSLLELYESTELFLPLYLREIPKEIKYLQNLTYLDVKNNRLTELPKEIGKLKKLESLDLRDNELTELPKEMKKLQKLYGIALDRNKFEKFPEVLKHLKNLKLLDINKNENFFKEIKKLNLKELYLDDEEIDFEKFKSDY